MNGRKASLPPSVLPFIAHRSSFIVWERIPMPYLRDLVYLLALLLLSPWLLYRALTTSKRVRGLWVKLSGRAFLRAGDAPCAWFHGVSVGEVHLLRQVIAAFRKRYPDWQCVVSTTTETGFEEAR